MRSTAARGVRHWFVLACCALALLGCQSVPTPPVDARAHKLAALQRLGFVPAEAEWELSLGVKLLFESNVDEVSESGRHAMADLARTLAAVGVERVRVEGHTDSVGPARLNESLSLRRAESVAQELIKAEGRAQNRRVVVTVRVD